MIAGQGELADFGTVARLPRPGGFIHPSFCPTLFGSAAIGQSSPSSDTTFLGVKLYGESEQERQRMPRCTATWSPKCYWANGIWRHARAFDSVLDAIALPSACGRDPPRGKVNGVRHEMDVPVAGWAFTPPGWRLRGLAVVLLSPKSQRWPWARCCRPCSTRAGLDEAIGRLGIGRQGHVETGGVRIERARISSLAPKYSATAWYCWPVEDLGSVFWYGEAPSVSGGRKRKDGGTIIVLVLQSVEKAKIVALGQHQFLKIRIIPAIVHPLACPAVARALEHWQGNPVGHRKPLVTWRKPRVGCPELWAADPVVVGLRFHIWQEEMEEVGPFVALVLDIVFRMASLRHGARRKRSLRDRCAFERFV